MTCIARTSTWGELFIAPGCFDTTYICVRLLRCLHGHGRGPAPPHTQSDYWSSGSKDLISAGGSPAGGTTNFGLGRLPHRRAATTPLLPRATSFGPNTGTAQPQLTRHAPPHTCRYWGSRMDPDCVFSCLLRAAFSPPPPLAWHARFSPDRFAYRSASTRRILHS